MSGDEEEKQRLEAEIDAAQEYLEEWLEKHPDPPTIKEITQTWQSGITNPKGRQKARDDLNKLKRWMEDLEADFPEIFVDEDNLIEPF